MPEYRLGHDLDDDPVLRAGHVLDDPLEFTDGKAVVEGRDTARAIARRHTHIHVIGAVPEAVDEDDSEGDAGDGEEFDAESFVDRTPMSDVVEDIESGDYDGHLEAIEAAAEREGVQDAVDARQEASG